MRSVPLRSAILFDLSYWRSIGSCKHLVPEGIKSGVDNVAIEMCEDGCFKVLVEDNLENKYASFLKFYPHGLTIRS